MSYFIKKEFFYYYDVTVVLEFLDEYILEI